MADGGYEPLRLNLGAGDTEVPGYTPVDRKHGKEVYPLDVPDGSVDSIRASHVLEHFPHAQVMDVVRHWVDKLKPGGLIRIAVPDLEYIAREYLAGQPINVQGYLMGGQTDENDYHKCAFDREVLEEILIAAGLERIHEWTDDVSDCSSLPVSVNMGAFKPIGEQKVCQKTTAILSAPRFGPVMHFRVATRAFAKARVPYQIGGGAYWHQVISELLDSQAQASDYVITCDYDSVFSYEDVLELYRLMEAQPHADAICALQSKRGGEDVLFGIRDENGDHVKSMASYQLDRHLLPITTGHFGLTIFRSAALREHPHPWMEAFPNDDGKWGDGKVDADIHFWLKWKEEGKTLYLAPRVAIGHIQEMITWPRADLKPVYQTLGDYDADGKPKEAIQ